MCDLKEFPSASVAWNMKSGGKRTRFRCLIEDFRRHAVEFRKVAVEHDFVPADQVNPALDQLNWNRQPIGRQ